MFYLITDNGFKEAQDIVSDAVGYCNDSIRSLGKDDVIEPASENDTPELNIIFISDNAPMGQIMANADYHRDPGAALCGNLIYVSMSRFQAEWDADEQYRNLVIKGTSNLKPSTDDLLTAFVSVCLADLMMRRMGLAYHLY